jgi:hypothetical protein
MSLPPRKPEHVPAGKLHDELYNRKFQSNPQQIVDIQMNSPGNFRLTTNQLRSVKDVELLPTSPSRGETNNWTPKAQQYLVSMDKQSHTSGKPPKVKLRNQTLLPEL